MFIPFRPISRRKLWGLSLRIAISLPVAFGLAGLFVQLPPLGPPGTNPSKPNIWKKCPKCGNAVRPKKDGHCVCSNCHTKFEAVDADDYS